MVNQAGLSRKAVAEPVRRKKPKLATTTRIAFDPMKNYEDRTH